MKHTRILSALIAGLLATSTLVSGLTVHAAAESGTKAAAQTYVAVSQPTTHIVGDIAMIREINSKAELDAVSTASTKPATTLYTVNKDLKVLGTDGAPFATLDEVLTALNYKILPAFRISDQATADALITYLKELNFFDCLLISADQTLLKTTREALPYTVGVLDCTETYKDAAALTTEQCLDIRRATKTYNANVAILPAHLCTKDTVQYLFEHQVNVWTQISDEPTVTEQYHALLSGAVGVISDATDSLLDIACNKLAENTLTRTPLNVGHRGIPTLAPECTVEGSLLAYENSANVVEMDVFLTADGHVAAMHDITTGDTCNGDLHMEDCTLAELKELYVNRGWENDPTYGQLRIPTLNEYMDAFKDKDCMLFIEIKSHKEEIVPIIRDMVNEYGMYDQCTVITFNEDTMGYMRKHWPEMALGVLCEDWYGFMNGSNPDEDLRTVMEFAAPHNGTVNPGWESYSPREIRAFMLRGISVNPWTFYGDNDYKNHFLDGFSSLTGNDAHVIKRLTQYVSYTPESTQLLPNDVLALNTAVTTYNRNTSAKAPSCVTVLEGEELISIDGNQMTVVGESGQISFILGVKDRTLGYTIYTQPTTLSIQAEEETTVTETESQTLENTATTAEPGTSAGTSSSNDGGCASTVSGIVLVLPALAAAWVACKKKED